MKAVCINAPMDIQVKEMKPPERKAGEARIRIISAGICGSDVGTYRGTSRLVSYPRIIGHELAGIVEEIDENKKGIVPGDRVIVDPYLFCGKCYPCRQGRTNCCESLRCLGVQVDGGMAEYFVHPSDMLIKIPDVLSWDIAPLAEPLTIALHAIHRTKLRAQQHFAINGAGTIGILAALAAKEYRAIPILIDVVQTRLDFARRLGVEHTINLRTQDLIQEIKKITGGQMAEAVLEASGANPAIRNSLEIAAYTGRIALTGWPKEETLLPTDMITKKELDVCGSRTSAGEFEEAVELITMHKVDVCPLLSKTVGIGEAPDIMKSLAAHPDQYLKVHVLVQDS